MRAQSRPTRPASPWQQCRAASIIQVSGNQVVVDKWEAGASGINTGSVKWFDLYHGLTMVWGFSAKFRSAIVCALKVT
ncbi:unnamed protein product [Protopolystoma xenopodis]|uniref:Uncharacterized protein n=1 Tax=Protopolystoma xenopodis TaxID=117903 RepID=A0A3S5FEU8_9PLAT|nr:unnamed protein product [Protopolystoma xenopodis]